MNDINYVIENENYLGDQDMSLIDRFRHDDIPHNHLINTGTLLDLATGKFRPATGGFQVLDGGLPQCMGIAGRAQTYKSTTAASFLVRAMEIHPESEAYIYETENQGDLERYSDLTTHNYNLDLNRILFKQADEITLTQFSDEFNSLVEDKILHKKDYLVESPFINLRTGKPYQTWIPTFVLIDSFSRARSSKNEEQYTDTAIDDSGMNTYFLSDGNVKTKFLSDLPLRAAKAGIYVILTAHMGNKMDMNPYAPTPKQLQYMKNTDKMKGVGSNFEFLTSTLLQTLKATELKDSNKQCEFPKNGSAPNEVNQIDSIIVRCKNNSSGTQVPLVVSQAQGLLDQVTNFLLLKNNKFYGIENQGNRSFTPLMYPSVKLTRTTIRDLTEKDYMLTRALELTAQLCFIQSSWNMMNQPDYMRISIERFVDLINNSQDMSVQRVLNSTGVWSTSKQDKERLTLVDILMFLDKEKNKHPVSVVAK